MPRSSKGPKFILCIIDVVTNYLITVPIYQSKAEEINDTLIEHDVMKYCVPDCIMVDQDSAFMLSLMNYLTIRYQNKDHCAIQSSILAR